VASRDRGVIQNRDVKIASGSSSVRVTAPIGDLLTLAKIVEPGALDGADMDENILAAVIRLDEAKALRGVEPLHCSLRDTSFRQALDPAARSRS
jgi:hypothetical protein